MIHLVRDPRGSYSSRLKYKDFGHYQHGNHKYKTKHLQEMQILCTQLMNAIQYIKEHPQYQSKQYILVRYEDIALHPLLYTSLLYNYTGFPVSQEVNEWLKNATSSSRRVSTGNKDRYSLSRNSSLAAISWTKHLTTEALRDIQDGQCLKLLYELGYKKYPTFHLPVNKPVYKDDITSSIIGDVPRKSESFILKPKT